MTVRSSALQSKQSDLLQEFQQAVRLYQQGRRDEALSACNAIVTQDPSYSDALHLQGIIHYQCGRNSEASVCLEVALRVRPTYLPILSGLALVYIRLRRFTEALSYYDKILKIDPGNLEGLHNRANVLMELGRHSEVLACYDQVLAFRPNVADAHYNRGNALRELGRLVEALASYDRTLALRADDAKALRSRSDLLIELERFPEAIESLDKLLGLFPDNIEARDRRAQVLKRLDARPAPVVHSLSVAPAERPGLSAPYRQTLRLAQRPAAVKRTGISPNKLTNEKPSEILPDFGKALSLSQQGRSDEAISHCEAILKERPFHFDALHLLGFLFYQRGQNLDAIDCLCAAAKQQPADVETLTVLSVLQFKERQHAGLLTTCNCILALQPHNVDALINRGCALMELKRQTEALQSFNTAVQVAPNSSLAHSNRGNALRELGQPQAALHSFGRALSLDPYLVSAWTNQGHVLLALKHYLEALDSFERSLSYRSDQAEALNGRGVALMGLGRHNEALQSYDDGIVLDPAYEGLYENKASALTEMGRTVEAAELIETAINLAPDRALLYYKLVNAKRLTNGDRHFDAMQRLYKDIYSLSIDDQIYLHFGLAKSSADANNPERGFQHWQAGAALKRSQIAYDECEVLGGFERTQAAFTSATLGHRLGAGEPSSAPIFIVGMPRSGSTLVEQILASHSKVHGAGEINELAKAIAQQSGFPSPEDLARLSAEALHQLGSNYIDRVRRLAPPTAERIVDKMLDNFQFIGLIHMALPNARIIHTYRDPIDTCFSCFTTLFAETNLPFTYDLGELGRYYRAYEALMEHWRSVLPAGVMLDVQYEDVVADLEGQTRRILDFCSLDWDPRCLDFHQTERPVHTASVNQVRQPLYKSSVGRAKMYGQYLGPLLEAIKVEHSVASFDRAAADAIALNNQGAALRDAKRFEEALTHFNKALALKPDQVDALINQGHTLTDLKRTALALASYEKALTYSFNDVRALTSKGNALIDLLRFEEALECYEKALRIDPNDASIYTGRGLALRGLRRHDNALASFDKALALQPHSGAAYHAKGVTLSEIGQLDAASDAIETAIKLSPKEAAFFYHSLSVCKRFSSQDAHIGDMQTLARDMRSLTPDAQIALHFSLSKAYADLNDYDQSFRHLLDGNALKRREVVYGEIATLGILTRTRAAFSAEMMRIHEGQGNPSSLPIFVVGMPRSGSTLIEQILASHPQVYGAGQIDEAEKSIIGRANKVRASASPEALSRLSSDELRELASNYLGGIQSEAPSAKRVIDKTLENFAFIGLIHSALPNARFIHTYRDPVDTCLSCFSTLFNDNYRPYSYDLAELGRYYRGYEALMAHWRSVLPAGIMLDLRYEDVVADFEGQTRRLLDFCGLDWNSRCLDFHQTTRPVHTASKAQVRQPLYKSSVGRAQAYQQFLGPLLAELS